MNRNDLDPFERDLNERCRMLGDMDFNPRQEGPIRNNHFNAESATKEHEVHEIMRGVALHLSVIVTKNPVLVLDGWTIVKIPDLMEVLAKIEIT